MNILNLYAGIGGNRRLWEGHQVTAVEIRPDIAAVYKKYFPQDDIIIGDAHEYLLKNYRSFDFIWASPPCPTHSRARYFAYVNSKTVPPVYPDMTLYQEIIFLREWFSGLFVAENVIPYYEPLLTPSRKLGRHLFWANFGIEPINVLDADINQLSAKGLADFHNYDLSGFDLISRKDDLLRNCVAAETGLHILNCAVGKFKSKSNQLSIF